MWFTDFDFKLTTNNSIHSHNTRTSKNLHLPKANTNWGKQKPTYQDSNDFNNLDNTIKNTDSLPKFKIFLKKLTVKNCIERTNCIVLYCIAPHHIVSYCYCIVHNFCRTPLKNTSVKWVSLQRVRHKVYEGLYLEMLNLAFHISTVQQVHLVFFTFSLLRSTA